MTRKTNRRMTVSEQQGREIARLRVHLNEQMLQHAQAVRLVTKERDLLRDHAAKRFKWWMDLLADGKAPSVVWLIQEDAKLFQALERYDVYKDWTAPPPTEGPDDAA